MTAATPIATRSDTVPVTQTAPVLKRLSDVVLVDPSELTEDAQDDLAHYVLEPRVLAGPGYVEALCGESVMEDDPEGFVVDTRPAPDDHVPDDVTLLRSRCQRISDVVRAMEGGRR